MAKVIEYPAKGKTSEVQVPDNVYSIIAAVLKDSKGRSNRYVFSTRRNLKRYCRKNNLTVTNILFEGSGITKSNAKARTKLTA